MKMLYFALMTSLPLLISIWNKAANDDPANQGCYFLLNLVQVAASHMDASTSVLPLLGTPSGFVIVSRTR